MSTANQHVFSHGMRDTRETLEAWSERPLGGPARLAGAEPGDRAGAAGGDLVRRRAADPGPDPDPPAGLTEPSEPGDLLPILWRNSLVLALHGTACVAGFIAGASMPIAAAQRTGFSRWVHVKAGELAILFVCAVTLFSLGTQALYLGFQGSTLAFQLAHLPPRADPQRAPARDPGADRALPAAGRLADRQPPRRVEPAARRDLDHRRRSRSRP